MNRFYFPRIKRPRGIIQVMMILLSGFSVGDVAGETYEAMEVQVQPEPTWLTRKNARVYSLLIPPPRGQIVDRDGRSLARTKAMAGLYLRVPAQSDFSEKDLRIWARRVEEQGKLRLLPGDIDFEKLAMHQKNRATLPFFVKELGVGGVDLRKTDWIGEGGDMLVLHRYARYYPENKTASHIIGYTGRVAPDSTKPLENNDLLFGEDEGREGLELVFDEFLRGEYGRITVSTDEDGRVVGEKLEKKPRPGGTIVTTLSTEIQKLCEKVLAEGGRNGSIVVLDVETGEILALASHPSFDLNLFTPSISKQSYAALVEDERSPLFARAFQAVYPPGSTFKAFVGLAALESGVISEESTISCPSGLKIGNVFFGNHSGDMGELNIHQAMAKSCNTWFYQIGLLLGGNSILQWAEAFGFGRRTGILLPSEGRGLVPRDDHMIRAHGRSVSRGDVANMSIGQGDILVSPLQMAHAMGTVANNGVIVQPRIVLQIQDVNNEVTGAYPKRVLGKISIAPDNLKTLRKSLVEVTTSGTGGMVGKFKNFKVAGKTGTSQWGPESHRKNVAWFTGFAPANDPKYAFAVAIEGGKGENISGGKTAAGVAGEILKELLKNYSAEPFSKEEPSVEAERNKKAEGREDGGVEEGVDYSNLIERFVDEIEDEKKMEGGEVTRADTPANLNNGPYVPQPSSDRTYDYVPEGMGRILE